jgi:heptaprenyl diphosphate synthase
MAASGVLEKFRVARRGWYQRLFSSRDLFIAGLIIMPALLFNPVPLFRVVQFLLFWFLAWLCGKRNNPLVTLLIVVFIVAFNLLIPYGREIYSIGNFKITMGALMEGIKRAVTLEGLIMLSRVTIRQDLRLPGSLGRLIGDSFRIFEEITERKGAIDRKNIAGSLDKLLIELSEDKAAVLAQDADGGKRRRASSLAGYCILVFIILLSWAPQFLLLWLVHLSS